MKSYIFWLLIKLLKVGITMTFTWEIFGNQLLDLNTQKKGMDDLKGPPEIVN